MRVAGKSDVGQVRGHNEDVFLVDQALNFCVVCDGMGGHDSGEVAAQMTAARVHERVKGAMVRTAQEAAEVLSSAIRQANYEVYERGRTAQVARSMGTTCTSVVVVGSQAALAHVGDSRLYLVRGEQIHQLSADHTYIAEALRHGVMTPEQARDCEHTNVVTRAVGPQPEVLVDTLTFDVMPGDRLLLCSDGLHGYFEQSGNLLPLLEGTPEVAVERLVEEANRLGGEDNISAVVAHLEPTQHASHIASDHGAVRHVRLFAELGFKELTRVFEHLHALTVESGHKLVEEGDVSDSLFILVDGSVAVERDGNQLFVLKPGAHFGELSLLTQRPRAATVHALTPSRLLVLPRAGFYRIVQQDPVVGVKFLWALGQELSNQLQEFYQTPEDRARRSTQTFGLLPNPFNDETEVDGTRS